jgi:phosphoglycolate phosphatase
MRPVVFDLDGTLIDSGADIALACNFMLQRAGRAPASDALISTFVGDGARVLVERAFGGELDPEEVDRQLEVFLGYYAAHPVEQTVLLPGVLETLDALSGRQLAVCTNKSRKTTLPVLEGLGLMPRFEVVVAGDDCPTNKPEPEMLLSVAKSLGCAGSELVMVGDGPQDVLAARAVGAVAVGVKGGLLPLERLVASQPDVLLEQMGDLPSYLEKIGA